MPRGKTAESYSSGNLVLPMVSGVFCLLFIIYCYFASGNTTWMFCLLLTSDNTSKMESEKELFAEFEKSIWQVETRTYHA